MRALAVAVSLLAAACAGRAAGPGAAAGPADPSARALALADEYLARYFGAFPEAATVMGWPGRRPRRGDGRVA